MMLTAIILTITAIPLILASALCQAAARSEEKDLGDEQGSSGGSGRERGVSRG